MAVITDLQGNIIFSNEIGADPAQENWCVSGMRVMLTRFWASSTAYVILVARMQDGTLPEFPLAKATYERELCLWLGYLDYLRPVLPEDLGTRLLRVFVGVVDTIQGAGSGAGGFTITLQLRDRMKWLMDTMVTYNPAVDEGVGETPLRSNLILEIAQRGIGQVESKAGCAICGKEIHWDQAFVYDLGETKAAQSDDQRQVSSNNSSNGFPPADLWYLNNGPLAGKTRTEKLVVEENPYFRIYTTRAPINLQQGPNFLLSQQVPLDVFKYLAMQEVYPTEVFQDSRDGHFYYCPRANDGSGLDDPKRFNRTYYLQVTPPGVEPDVNQFLIAFKDEQSSIGLKTNFMVHKSAPTGQGAAQDDWTVQLRVQPAALEGVKYACRFTRIFDETITTAEEAAVVALNAARVMGKETTAATAVMIGDPSLVPGEVIQVLGSVIQPKRGLDRADTDRTVFKQFNGAYNDNLKTYAEESLKNAGAAGNVEQGATVTLPVYDGSTATVKVDPASQENQDALICQSSSSVSAPKASAPQTIYRCEAVIHKLNVGGKGFSSEVALLSPF